MENTNLVRPLDISETFSPISHKPCIFTEIVLNLSSNNIKDIIGNRGRGLKTLMKKTKCEYIWYNNDKNSFQIWGKNEEIVKNVATYLLNYEALIKSKTKIE